METLLDRNSIHLSESRRKSGFSLIETIAAIVLITASLAGMIQLMSYIDNATLQAKVMTSASEKFTRQCQWIENMPNSKIASIISQAGLASQQLPYSLQNENAELFLNNVGVPSYFLLTDTTTSTPIYPYQITIQFSSPTGNATAVMGTGQGVTETITLSYVMPTLLSVDTNVARRNRSLSFSFTRN